MYKCKECESPITEFDAAFYKGINKNGAMNQCKCYKCMTKGALGKILDNYDYFLSFYWMCWAVWVCPIVGAIGGLILEVFRFSELPLIVETIIYMCGALFIGAGMISALFFWIKGAIAVIDDVGLDLNSYEYHTGAYETTFDSSSGKATTREEVDYYCPDGAKAFWLGITFIWWCLPYYIYKKIKFSKILPKEIREAYKTARKHKIFAILEEPSEPYRKPYKKHTESRKKYNSQVKSIKETYVLMGEDYIKNKLNKLKEPKKVNFKIDGKNYNLVEEVRRSSKNLYYFQCVDDGTDIKIVFHDRFLYADKGYSKRAADIDWKNLKDTYMYKER